jgi:copper chaperone CopZ
VSSTTYIVSGMTCGHCVGAVTEEVTALTGVTDVEISLVPGGESTVAVSSEQPLAEDAVRAAIEEAGYELAGTVG